MTTQTEAQHYPNHDAEALGQDYINHISAMTTEGLRAKSSIAIQLAWRDVEIRRLEAANAELLESLNVAYTQATKHDERLPFDWALYCEALHIAIKKHGGAA